jgi:hypothetical protein
LITEALQYDQDVDGSTLSCPGPHRGASGVRTQAGLRTGLYPVLQDPPVYTGQECPPLGLVSVRLQTEQTGLWI